MGKRENGDEEKWRIGDEEGMSERKGKEGKLRTKKTPAPSFQSGSFFEMRKWAMFFVAFASLLEACAVAEGVCFVFEVLDGAWQ